MYLSLMQARVHELVQVRRRDGPVRRHGSRDHRGVHGAALPDQRLPVRARELRRRGQRGTAVSLRQQVRPAQAGEPLPGDAVASATDCGNFPPIAAIPPPLAWLVPVARCFSGWGACHGSERCCYCYCCAVLYCYSTLRCWFTGPVPQRAYVQL